MGRDMAGTEQGVGREHRDFLEDGDDLGRPVRIRPAFAVASSRWTASAAARLMSSDMSAA